MPRLLKPNKYDPRSPCKIQMKWDIRCKNCDDKLHHLCVLTLNPKPTNITNKIDKEVGEASKESEEVEEKITEKPNQIREIKPILMISQVQVRITVILVRNLVRKT